MVVRASSFSIAVEQSGIRQNAKGVSLFRTRICSFQIHAKSFMVFSEIAMDDDDMIWYYYYRDRVLPQHPEGMARVV